MKRDNTPHEPPTVFPWAQTLELMDAGRNKDHKRIDACTDTLVRMGCCRQRSDDSLFAVGSAAKQNIWGNG